MTVAKISVCKLAVAVKQFHARTSYPLHRLDGARQDLVRDLFIGLFDQGILQAPPPRNSQFGIDMDHIDPGSDGLPQVVIIGSRSAMQGKQNLRCAFDLDNS